MLPKKLPPKIGTHPTNAETHPGADPAVQKRKRRTKAEMEADKEEKRIQKEAEAEKKLQGVKRIAQFENEVAEQDANLVTPKPRLRPRPLKHTFSVLPLTDDMLDTPTDNPEPSNFKQPSTQDNVDNSGSELTEMEEAPPKKRGKKEKGFARETI
jgi:hypothetical protein